MSDKTKAVNLTEDEISFVLSKYGYKLGGRNFTDEDIDRINYLNKRLKAFKEPEEANVPKPETKPDAGWGTKNG